MFQHADVKNEQPIRAKWHHEKRKHNHSRWHVRLIYSLNLHMNYSHSKIVMFPFISHMPGFVRKYCCYRYIFFTNYIILTHWSENVLLQLNITINYVFLLVHFSFHDNMNSTGLCKIWWSVLSLMWAVPGGILCFKRDIQWPDNGINYTNVKVF